MEKREKSVDNREYTIKIIPHQGSDVRSIHLPIQWIKYALGSVLAVVLLLAGAFSYSVYSSYSLRNEASQIEKLKEANSLQQEQLLELSKKANNLQDAVDQLGQIEKELRQLTGIAGDDSGDANSNKSNGTHNGQGGPLKQKLDIKDVSSALDDVEKRVEKRKASLERLRDILNEQHRQIQEQESINASTPSIWPSTGDISSPYGLRWGGSDFHPGIDIADDYGTPIVATADGIVTVAGWNSGGYGNMVDIDHGNGYMTRYGHAQQVVVSAGEHVKRGQVIAYMGSTGFSTGPHVHYEVRVNGQLVNPSGYIR
ncbi:Peptidase, M23/M37 family [Anaerovibrio sp. JC8]|uniref:M23 family metallopeptidase n=1 Tax=Anaerovibrio sp. JC8 TaxID=1240085 RepID=UPI000A0C7F38|nr:M23 family metallopeptidase [Anaerovibrio sp. JC8]ORT98854.1 Peptidase, M23/M37 family [Anaerovibrio sp. JC8]